MRLKSARFKNVIGIYRPSGLEEIYIDFQKCKHNIILISGPNGSGKSTLMSLLHPLPDSPSMYIPEKEGLKEIEYIEGYDIYRVRIIYPITTTKTRATTKAFLTKITPNGEEIEFNPNGNIGSFKSELFNKFNLDPNFVSLSKLSTEDKGIVDKSPSERKKFVNNILESVEVYNNIFKSLSKRSSVYRSMINSITAKIDNIGNEEQLISRLSSIEFRLTNLENEKTALIKSLSDSESIIKLIDPDGSIQMLYNDLHYKVKVIEEQMSAIKNILINYKYENKEEVIKKYNEVKNKTDLLQIDIASNKDQIQNLLIGREEESKALQLKSQRLNSLKSDYSYEELTTNINTLKTNQKKYIDIFHKIGLENFNITKDEYILGLTTLKDLKDMVDTMRSYADKESIESAIDSIVNNINIVNEVNRISSEIDQVKESISNYREQINYYTGISKTLIILNDRPNKCKIDDCPFIKDAVSNLSLEPDKKITSLDMDIEYGLKHLEELNIQLERVTSINKLVQSINIIIRSIRNNTTILSKLPNGYIFGNIEVFLDNLQRGHTFNEINDLYKYLDYANILEKYKNEKDILTRLESEYKIYENKHAMIDDISEEINTLSNKITNITSDIEERSKVIFEKSQEYDDNCSLMGTLNQLIDKYDVYKILQDDKVDIISKINTVRNNIANIETATMNINQISSKLENIKKEIEPLSKEQDELKYSLNNLKQYNIELADYNEKFNYIELIKKYTSPTKGGIQNIFMKMYMGQTLSIANELLGSIFDGRLQLLPYVINETEFRIPCKSGTSDIINDDISSCSTAERSMISMIISFALLKQSSTLYNVLTLDELDGALDASNRGNFLMLLTMIMDILKVEHCVLVSHSSELELSNVDIIWTVDDEYITKADRIPEGNIIFTYSKN